MDSTSAKLPFGSEIRRIRCEYGLSTSQVAHRLGTAQSSVVRLEQSESHGSITLSSLARVAEVLNCKLEYRLIARDSRRRKNPCYSGMRRLQGARRSRSPSSVSKELREQELTQLRTLSPADRIAQAFSLSDLAWSIGRCSR